MDSKAGKKAPDPRSRLRLVKPEEADSGARDRDEATPTPGSRKSQLARELSSFADALDREIAAILASP